jgi:import inner membrane translocase subunit TIM13
MADQPSPDQLLAQVRMMQEAQFAQKLLSTISDRCFEKCITKPKYTLDSSEKTCITSCADTFVESFGTVANTYAKAAGAGSEHVNHFQFLHLLCSNDNFIRISIDFPVQFEK